MMNLEIKCLQKTGLLDAGVLAVGVERGWVSKKDVIEYAVEMLVLGEERPEFIDLIIQDLDTVTISNLLWQLAQKYLLPSRLFDEAIRRWMYASLKVIDVADISEEEKLDRLEEVYAILDYPEEMSACSRYYISDDDCIRGISIGDKVTLSPLEAMKNLLSQIEANLGILI